MTSSAGFTFIRVPLGASDFSAKGKALSSVVPRVLIVVSEYTFNDAAGDNNLSGFNINAAPAPLYV
jgi:hypothetical protein